MFLNKERVILFFVISNFTLLFSQENKIQKDSLKINELDEVVVTATRTIRQLSSLPMPITVISKKQIENSGSVRLSDILLEQTGVNLINDVGGFRGVQMQGIDAAYTLIMINGVPLIGRSAGNLDLDRVTVNNIKQIEIVKGPSSSLYGSEAIGGVINIITEQLKQDELKGSIHYFLKVGAKNELDLNSNILYKKNKFGVTADVNMNSSNGFDLTPETSSKTTQKHQNFTGNIQLTYDFSKKWKALVSQRYFTQEQGEDNTGKQTEWNINSKITQKIAKNWQVDYTFYATKFKTESEFFNGKSFFNQTLLRPEIRTKFKLLNGIFVAGLGANVEVLDRTSFLRKEKFNAYYGLIQYDVNPTEKWNLIVGARFDKHNKYQSAFSPKVSSLYKINNWLAVKGSVGFGFKAPDFRQLFFNFNNSANGYIVLGTQTLQELYGNLPEVENIETNLKPETSIGYNLGFQIQPLHNLKLNINVFRNNIKDLINTFSLPNGLPNFSGIQVFSYENRDEIYTQGVELDITYKITKNFSFYGGYQFLQAKDIEEENLIKSGAIYYRKTASSPSRSLDISDYFGLANRSKHSANTKLFYENLQHKFSANIRVIYRSKYALFDTNNSNGIIDDFDDFVASNTQINIAASKTLFNFMKVQVGIDNLLNEKGLKNKDIKSFNRSLDAIYRLGSVYYGKIQFNF